jgi:hypothetical protein
LNNLGNLTVRNRDDDAWPEKRVSIANEDGALFINARYLKNPLQIANQIVNCVNVHNELLEALKRVTEGEFESEDEWLTWHNKARTVIAKAEGK